MSENTNAVELHGCIVCARIFNVLVVYTPDEKLVNCAVTSPGGHCVKDERDPLVACDFHSQEAIESALIKWKSRYGKELGNGIKKNKPDSNGL